MKTAVLLLSLGVALAAVEGSLGEKPAANESQAERDFEMHNNPKKEMDDYPRKDMVERVLEEWVENLEEDENLEPGLLERRGEMDDVQRGLGVSGYRRRKGYCSVFEDSIRHLKTVKTPQECAKQCSAETRCKTFQYLDGSKYEIKCVLKTKVCKKPATDVKGGYIYTRRGSGYRRRKGYCSVFEDSIRHLKEVKTPQECAKQCSAETRCKTFQYLDGSNYKIKCVLKTKVCKKPATDVKGGYIYTRCKSAEPETVE